MAHIWSGNKSEFITSAIARLKEREAEHCRTFAVIVKAVLGTDLSLENKGLLIARIARALADNRKRMTLEKELKEAERALGEDPSEQNFAWLTEVRKQLAGAA